MKKTIAEVAQDKFNKDKKMSLREFQINNIHVCSSIRDIDFPRYCRQGGLDLKRQYKKSIWLPLWDAMMADIIQARDLQKKKLDQWSAEHRWDHFH